MASALIIGPEQKHLLQALRGFALRNPIDMPAAMKQIQTPEGAKRHRLRMNKYTVTIPTAFLVTFSIENGHPSGTLRHMSMSSKVPGRVPHPLGVWMVCEELGFVGGLEQCTAWPETCDDGETAINVVQPIAMQEVVSETPS